MVIQPQILGWSSSEDKVSTETPIKRVDQRPIEGNNFNVNHGTCHVCLYKDTLIGSLLPANKYHYLFTPLGLLLSKQHYGVIRNKASSILHSISNGCHLVKLCAYVRVCTHIGTRAYMAVS